jgi:peptidyl-prolyl cis-trans isomerase SurA
MSELKGVITSVQKRKKRIFGLGSVLVAMVFVGACGAPGGNSTPGSIDANETAAKVNGQAITMEEVDRSVRQQAGDSFARLSPLEVASARLQVLQDLIANEVMYQKAQKENLVPTDEEITGEINKQKVENRMSAEEFDKQMKEAGWNDKTYREFTKQRLSIAKLVDKITSRVDAPKDSEIEAFYNGNKEAFVKKRGAKLAAIVIDPANSGQGDQTTDDQSAAIKGNEIVKKLQSGQDFASLAREYSEDQSKLQGGDLGYVAEDEMKQMFPAPIVGDLMRPDAQMGKMVITQAQGKFFILKLQEQVQQDESLSLDSPGVRQQVTDALVNNRKQLLSASYQAIAMNEAKIENFLAKKVVDNPNELSGARPAGASAPTSNSNAASNTNSNTSNAAPNANTAANAKPADNTTARPNAKPAATAGNAANK